MKNITRALLAAALVIPLTAGVALPASATHEGSAPGHHNWVCSWFPVFC